MAVKTELGTLKIRNEVIGTIAALAAQEVPGVVEVWRGWWPLRTFWGDSGVKVQAQEQEVRVTIRLVVEYGVNLAAVATQVQERVRQMIERMTPLSVGEVRLTIHHVKPKREEGK